MGKTVLITGGNSGIGLASAEILAGLGWNVLLLCRNPKKAEPVVAELKKAYPTVHIQNYTADLSDFEAIKSAAAQISKDHPSLDVLLNNAGFYPDTIEYVGDVEKTLYASHLGHMLLTHLLMPILGNVKEARVINVSSAIHPMGRVERFFKKVDGLTAVKAYADAKLANILFTMALAKRLPASITTYSLHPGVIRTGFAQTSGGFMGFMVRVFGWMLTKPAKGAETSVFLTTANIDRIKGDSGKYFDKSKVKATSNKDVTPDNAEWLWTNSEEILKPYW